MSAAGKRACPTCGQQLPNPRDAAWLLELLTNGLPHRQVYRAGDGSGRWFVTCGGGEVREAVVHFLLKSGRIVSTYSDCPDDMYHVGRTLDCQRTFAERKHHKRAKDAPRIYVGDPGTPR